MTRKTIVLVVIIGILVGFSPLISSAQTTRTVSVPIEIDEGVANLALVRQYERAGIPMTVSGTTAGISYTIDLSLPQVDFQSNTATVNLQFDVVSSVGNYGLNVDVPISIQPLSVSVNQIIAVLNNFPSVLQSVSGQFGVPTSIQNIIIAEYQNLELEMYPQSLLDSVNDVPFIAQRGLSISDLGLSVQFIPDHIKLTLSSDVVSDTPAILFGADCNKLYIQSNIEAVLVDMFVYTINGQRLYNGENLNIDINQGFNEVDNRGSICGTNRVVILALETDDTWYEWKRAPFHFFGNLRPPTATVNF